MVDTSLDEQILDLIGRYRIAVRSVLRLAEPDDAAVDAAIKRLRRADMIRVSRAFAGGRSAYQLTPNATRALQLPESRARRLKPQALHKHAGILLFCHVAGSNRFRLDDMELSELFRGDPLDGTHCIGLHEGIPIVLHTYVPGSATSLDSVVRRVRKDVRAARKHSIARHLIDRGSYGLAIVVDSAVRERSIVNALHRARGDGRRKLYAEAPFVVESVEEFDTLVNGPPY